MSKSKTKKNTKELSKIKKTKKKLLNPFSLQPLTDAYKNFKKKQKREIANKIKRDKIEQTKQLLEDKVGRGGINLEFEDPYHTPPKNALELAEDIHSYKAGNFSEDL